MPGGFGPPTHYVFAYTVEMVVALDHFEDPVRKEVYVGVAVGGLDFYLAVFANQAVADWEAFFVGGDISEGICCAAVEESGDIGS